MMEELDQNKPDRERKAKEMGAKVYKVLLHLATIASIVLLYRSVMGENHTEDTDSMWVFYAILIGYLVLRLASLSIIEKGAKRRGMKVTEYTEFLKEERDKLK